MGTYRITYISYHIVHNNVHTHGIITYARQQIITNARHTAQESCRTTPAAGAGHIHTNTRQHDRLPHRHAHQHGTAPATAHQPAAADTPDARTRARKARNPTGIPQEVETSRQESKSGRGPGRNETNSVLGLGTEK